MGNVLSIPLDHLPYGKCRQNVGMDYYKLRAELVRELIRTSFNDSFAQFSAHTGIDTTIISRWFSKKKGKKNIGEDMARKIEDMCGLDRGTLVVPDKLAAIEAGVFKIGKAWPFPSAKPARIDRLSPDDRVRLDDRVARELADIEDKANTSQKRSRR